MIIHGISLDDIKALSDVQWQELDESTRKEYELILSYERLLPNDFVDNKDSIACWLSDLIAEYVDT
ncbi:TPA: hypothetical protein ACPDXI_002215 [Pasteurella multocida]